MLISPAFLALNGGAMLVSLLMLMAAGQAVQVLRHWDIKSGSERQLALERRTYLIATLVTWSVAAELVALLLFLHTAESMSSQFVGAMCATGVLNAHALGWPVLGLKIAVFFAGAVWLLVNQLDNKSPVYPLVRLKYALLLALLPLVLVQALAQLGFFLGLNPDLITSCCGSLFTAEGEGVAAEVAGIDPMLSLALMYGSGVALLAAGMRYPWEGRCGIVYALAGMLAFALALVAIVSAVALYVYEHPHHHCPFCLLKAGRGFIGYWLYLSLFAGAALALGVGVISPLRRVASISAVADAQARRLTTVSLGLFALFYLIATFAVVGSNLTMEGVWW
ncbi:MAG: hypothetical protein MUC77_17480 [Chromatiaceae bacterium]|jgi:hypothetical protein|nr:hypothetical protein [Chromatiaceae bacterium]